MISKLEENLDTCPTCGVEIKIGSATAGGTNKQLNNKTSFNVHFFLPEF